jgi:disulfide bond formation protein DsbB
VLVTDLFRRLLRERLPLLFLAASGGLLLAAFLFQHVGGLEPCPLCVAQRYPHFAALGHALAALTAGRRLPVLAPILFGMLAACYLVGAGYAAFHVGVELGHFQSACSGHGASGSLEELRARLHNAPRVLCDEVQWSLFGLSMAAWNGIASVVLALVAGYGGVLSATTARRRPTHGRARPTPA